MASSVAQESPFRFLQLPPEIRNMIYRWLVIRTIAVKDAAFIIRSSDERLRRRIDTSVLYLNSQIYKEASCILYAENHLYIRLFEFAGQPVRILRVDKIKLMTRNIRNGRQVNMTKSSGRIYPHVLSRFAKATIELQCCPYHITISNWATGVGRLFKILKEMSQPVREASWSTIRELVIDVSLFPSR